MRSLFMLFHNFDVKMGFQATISDWPVITRACVQVPQVWFYYMNIFYTDQYIHQVNYAFYEGYKQAMNLIRFSSIIW